MSGRCHRAGVSGMSFASVVLLVAVFLVGSDFAGPKPAFASSAADFSPGNVITDARFHDSASMNVSQIQSFIQSKELNCVSGSTCLRDFRQTTFTRGADAQCSQYVGQPSEIASQILSRVATACGINPQVLLVLLEKEQGLVGSTSPSASRFSYATGFACPDTAPCDAQYIGFYNQVYKAAWQYRYYENNPRWFNWFPVGKVTKVLYNPDPSCDTQAVFIENQATANLYYYTPYVPNSAALANFYGVGDGCSAYGNRNFFRIFSDWFGSPSGAKSTFGSVDSVFPVVGGIQVTGWSLDPYASASSYIWVNVDGNGGPVLADRPLNWIDGAFPGAGPNHGYDTIIPTTPGPHSVCVYGTNSALLGCKTITVLPSQGAAGAIESVTASIGKISITGWSLNTTSADTSYIWVTLDGRGTSLAANGVSSTASTTYPSLGGNHGFSADIPASGGRHEICVSGYNSVPLGCRVVFSPESARGSFDAATAAVGTIVISGWSLDLAKSDSTFIWVTLDGVGQLFAADKPLNWINSYYPGAGSNHGFLQTLTASAGPHQICIWGTNSIVIGCKTVMVPSNGMGSFDSATAVPGGIRVTGWALDKTSSASVYVWANVDGNGGPIFANGYLDWIEGYVPGVGLSHGFDSLISAGPGTHQVCLFGLDSQSLGCKTALVG